MSQTTLEQSHDGLPDSKCLTLPPTKKGACREKAQEPTPYQYEQGL